MLLTDDDPFGDAVDESTEVDDRGPGDECDRLPGMFPTHAQSALVLGVTGATSLASVYLPWRSGVWVASLFS